MKQTLRFAALGLALVALPAFAQSTTQGVQNNMGPGGGSGGPGGGQGGPGGQVRMACKDDVEKFCKGIQPGGGRIKDCLEDHYKEISDPCYSIMKKMASGGGRPPNDSSGGPPQNGLGGPPPDNGPGGQ